MNEQILKEKLQKLEALFARPGTEGERLAAEEAIERIRARLEEIKAQEAEEEYKFSLRDAWSQMLFVALCRRYGLTPYRYSKQRRSTVMLRVPASFVDQTLWPEFVELNKTLQEYLRATTERIIKESVYQTLLKRGCQIAPGDSKVDSDRFGIRIAIKGTKGYFW